MLQEFGVIKIPNYESKSLISFIFIRNVYTQTFIIFRDQFIEDPVIKIWRNLVIMIDLF